jgi:hypothetical protein
METQARLIQQAERVIARLEKLTPDLRLAHHASGLRRTLLRLTRERPTLPLVPRDEDLLRETLDRSERLLIQAAREKMRRGAAAPRNSDFSRPSDDASRPPDDASRPPTTNHPKD